MKKFLSMLILIAVFTVTSQAETETTSLKYVEKSIATKVGVDAQIWFVRDVYINAHPKRISATITLGGWASLAAYQADADTLDTQHFRISSTDLQTLLTVISNTLFEKIIEQPQFANGLTKTYTYNNK